MVNFLIGLFVLVLLILLLLSLPINVLLTGSLKSIPERTSYSARVQIGGKRFGVMYQILDNAFVGFGPYVKPWFQWNVQQKSIFGKKDKPKKAKSAKTSSTFTIRKFNQYREAVFSSIRWKMFSLSGYLQLDNPMHTGLLFGGIHSVMSSIPNRVSHVTIKPGFLPERDTDVTGSLRIVIFPISLPLKLFLLRLNSNSRKDKS